jgi:hypothetical protein
VSTPISCESDTATPAMLEDNLLSFSFPAVDRKKVSAAAISIANTAAIHKHRSPDRVDTDILVSVH